MTLGLAVGAAARPASPASAPGSVAEATVYIRVTGDVRTEFVQGWRQAKETREVDIATGSGFVITPSGYVVTNHHVVAPEEIRLPTHGLDVQELRVTLEVRRIEVVFPGGAGGDRAFEASVVASDPGLDLALLSVVASDLPTQPLGDSDALEQGQLVTAWGYPFGRRVEVAREAGPPRVSASPGSVSALRADDEGDARYIQTDVTMNPGNSGGPLVDADGNAVGVVRMKLRNADRVGFAIPINLVKDFVEPYVTGGGLPPRLRLGPQLSNEWKGLRLRAPEGWSDMSSARLTWNSAEPSESVSLVIERVASPWTAANLEAHLMAGGFGEPRFEGAATPRPSPPDRPRDRFGSARRAEAEIELAVLDLGREKVVARFTGPPAVIAYNRSVLRRSLDSLEADRLLVTEVAQAPTLGWERVSLATPNAPALVVPAGWVREPAEAAPAPLLPAADAGISASPPGDFTVTCQALWWGAPGATPEQATAARVGAAASSRSTYAFREVLFGIAYRVDGAFLPLEDGLLRLEVRAPEAKSVLLAGLLPAWRKALEEQRGP